LKKLFLLAGLGVLFYLTYRTGLAEHLNLQALKAQKDALVQAWTDDPFKIAGLYFLVYVISVAVSLPGATILTLAGGAVFGLGWGLVLVSFASTLGATLAMLAARFLFSDWVRAKFGYRMVAIDQGIKKDGARYLLTLRLVPAFPFFLINLAMGLTRLPVRTFFWVSQLGMLPGTLVYVNAGTELSKIESVKGLLSPTLILSFTLIGLLPWIARFASDHLKYRRQLARFSKPKTFDYNMVVVGAGSAGLVSAYIAAAVKAKVALIERHKMGGDCLNTGCVPSKALIRAGKTAKIIRAGAGSAPDYPSVLKHVSEVIKKIEPNDSIERYEGLGVECFKGNAEVLSPFAVKVGDRVLTTKNIVIATGAGPLVPDLPGLRAIEPLTSDTLWDLNQLPRRLLVLGGGAIGCELAQALCRLGSKVTLLERNDRLLHFEDPKASVEVLSQLQKDGVAVLLGHEAQSFQRENSGEVTVRVKAAGANVAGAQVTGDKTLSFDHVLVALGRGPRTQGVGLEALELETDSKGFLSVDEYLRTTKFKNVFACGDVTGPYLFTHVASHQAWYAAVNSLFSPFRTFRADYRVIPWCTFTDPEVARVGLNEAEAKVAQVPYEAYEYGIEHLDRAIADGEAKGFIKVLVKPGTDRILGVTIVAVSAGEMLAEYVLAMKHNLGLNDILGTIHTYPTMSEANKFVAGVWKKATAPQRLLSWVKRYHEWRRG
jgi:pyruvate/2-oxoglutarate dehydrogenase complex dihydrolipoamide dehydrogenase (E3) component/uncharacterized membrane protein YdjX (TVP38/TMEM64 family)